MNQKHGVGDRQPMTKPKGPCTLLGRALLILLIMSCVTLILASARVHGSIKILHTNRQLTDSGAGACVRQDQGAQTRGSRNIARAPKSYSPHDHDSLQEKTA